MSSVYSAAVSSAKSARSAKSASLASRTSAKTFSVASKASSSKSSGSQNKVSSKIAEDLLKLLDGSIRSASVASVKSNTNNEYLSEVELAILRSTNPIEVTETEEITVLGNRGLWTNKREVMEWRGDLSIEEYLINEDDNPEIITRKMSEQVEYVQELAVRYLRPPTPPAPGEIVITMEPNFTTGPAPPLIIRQQPARPITPEPLIVREAPPKPPSPVGPKRITISGKRIPPPPRKVVVERLAPLPSKPQNVIIERWLPYSEVKRRVVFNKPTKPDPVVVSPRNVIIQWEAPDVNISKEVKYLGVVRANPAEYVEQYGDSLSAEIPEFVKEIETPNDVGVLAVDYKAKSLIELEGQLEGFEHVNLDDEGLSEYRSYLLNLGISDLGAAAQAAAAARAAAEAEAAAKARAASVSAASVSSTAATALKIFQLIDQDKSGSITVAEAESIALKLNSRLNRSYGENDVKAFFTSITGDKETISQDEFVAAFERLV